MNCYALKFKRAMAVAALILVGSFVGHAAKLSYSDQEFFSELDLSYPGREATRKAVENGNLPQAKKEFCQYLRARKFD